MVSNDVVPAFQSSLDGGYMAVATLFAENEADAGTLLAQFKTWLNGRGARESADRRSLMGRMAQATLPTGLTLCTDDERSCGSKVKRSCAWGKFGSEHLVAQKLRLMMLASLPPGLSGTPAGVRDGLYATVALARMGPSHRNQDGARLSVKCRAGQQIFELCLGRKLPDLCLPLLRHRRGKADYFRPTDANVGSTAGA